MHGHGHADRIAEDVASADASGVAGTPSFFINGRRHEGAYDLATVSNAVRAARSCVSARRVAPARAADISRQGLYLHFANKEALFRAAVRQELDTALGDVSGCLKKEGVGLERRVVGALDAWLGRYAGSMLASDIGNLLQDPAMELGDIVDPAIAAFDARLAAAIAAAMSEKDRRRLAVTPEEIAAAVHTLAQGARHLSNARAESRAQFLARVTAGVRVVFAGLGTTARRTP